MTITYTPAVQRRNELRALIARGAAQRAAVSFDHFVLRAVVVAIGFFFVFITL